MKTITLSAIVPVFNEAATVAEIIRRLKKTHLVKEIIIVDDGSTDKTPSLLKQFQSQKNIIIFTHPQNRGKGMAIRTGVKAASGDYTIIQDADLEYDPEDFPKLLKPIKQGKAQVVYGSRFTGEHRNIFFWHWVANQLLTLTTNILYNTTLSDMETCYKVFPTKLLKDLHLRCRGFEFEPEVTAKVLKRGIRIYEVPVSYAGREYQEGKKISWVDGLIALLTLVRYKFSD